MPVQKKQILVNDSVKALSKSLGSGAELDLYIRISAFADNFSKGAFCTDSFILYLETVHEVEFINEYDWLDKIVFTIDLTRGITKKDVDNAEHKIVCMADKEHIYFLEAFHVNDPEFELYLKSEYKLLFSRDQLYENFHKEFIKIISNKSKSKSQEGVEDYTANRLASGNVNLGDNEYNAAIQDAFISFNKVIEQEIEEKTYNSKNDKKHQSLRDNQDRKSAILKELMDVNERLAILYARVHEYLESDLESALNNARKCAEVIAKVLNFQFNPQRPADSWGNLNDAIENLNKNKVISKLVFKHFQTIQNYGNFGSHDQGDESEALTLEKVEPCIAALNSLIEWWLKRDIDD